MKSIAKRLAKRALGSLCRRLASPPAVAARNEQIWSIGIYQGTALLDLQAPANFTNPVLTQADVTDVPALFVADPFMIRVDGTWHMFFEVLNKANQKGEIGYATSSDATSWRYQQIVLAEPFHLSYPCVFECNGDFYMIPESRYVREVRLYRASPFPHRWEYVATLFNEPFADSTIFRFEDRWWIFTDTSASFPLHHRKPSRGYRHDTVRLFYADQLTGPWHTHPKNPIISGDPHIARPGGRVFVGDSLIRFAQDCYPTYGTHVFGFRITQLSPTCYEEQEIEERPVLTWSGSGWNRHGMHHIDAHPSGDGQLIACVDGFSLQQVPG